MSNVYADADDVEAALSASYLESPDLSDVTNLILRASQLIDQCTMGRASIAYDNDLDGVRSSLTEATCLQIEFWLEVGPEHDVTGLRGSLVGGRVQVHPVAGTLAPRAQRVLQNIGLMWRGVDSR